MHTDELVRDCTRIIKSINPPFTSHFLCEMCVTNVAEMFFTVMKSIPRAKQYCYKHVSFAFLLMGYTYMFCMLKDYHMNMRLWIIVWLGWKHKKKMFVTRILQPVTDHLWNIFSLWFIYCIKGHLYFYWTSLWVENFHNISMTPHFIKSKMHVTMKCMLPYRKNTMK